ncbi:MAG: DNA polymerase III subunit beta [Candidatus Cloacimonetes bacterium]|nr:DNA polymerase III subunit beta [Candidatus Cloacimonadota bacterium]
MKFSIEKKDLLPFIQHLNNIIPSKNTMPILTNYLIKADENENQLIITATDLEITVIATIKANIMLGGKVAVSARKLMEILTRMPDEVINFIYQEDELLITSISAKFDLLCAEANQFPMVPDVDLADSVAFNAGLFRKMISSTSFAVSTEINRPIFTGINWTLDPEFQMMAATDGKKIAEFTHHKPTHVTERIDCIIPTKGLNFLDKVITENFDTVNVLIEPNRVIFSYDSYLLMTHVIEGRYPDYNKAIPKNNNSILIVDKEHLKQAIGRVSLLATEDTYKIHLSISNNSFIIDCVNREEGEAREKITEFTYDGKDIEIAFNYKFLLAIINVIETPRVEFKLGASNEAALLFNVDQEEDYSTRFLLMPLRLL